MRRHLTTGQRAMTAAALATMTAGARTDLEPRENSTEVKSYGNIKGRIRPMINLMGIL